MKDERAESVDRGRADPFLIGAIIAAVALLVFPMSRCGFLPFVDLPQHAALAQLLNHINDPAVSLIYTADLLPQVNILGLLIMSSLFAVMPEASALIVIVILYLAGLAFALDRLARALGTSRATVTVALLFAVNFNLLYGFMSFCLGIPVLILVLARLASSEARGPRRGVILDAALWMILLLAHALLFVFALAALLIWLVLAPSTLGRRIARLVSIAPAVIWVLIWRASGGAALGGPDGTGMTMEWHGLGEKLRGLGWSTIVAGVDGGFEWFVLGAAASLIAALLILDIKAQKGKERPEGPAEEVARARMRLWVRLVALLAIVLYFTLPYAIVSGEFVTRGLFLFYNRFAVLAPILLIPTLAWPRPAVSRRLLLAAVLLLHVGLAWNWSGMMSRLSDESRGLDEAIAAMAPGKILKSLIYTPYSGVVDFPVYLHAGSYYQSRKLGEVDQSFTILPTTPVHYRDPLRSYLSQHDEHLAPHLFDWRQAGFYDYILVYDRGGEWNQFYSVAPFKRAYERNGWVVLDTKALRR